ncbi:hypothetical protein ACOSQ3_013569 [Xanthoceras sorbifolium]
MLLQVNEGSLPTLHSRKKELEKYLAISTLAKRESGEEKILHPCLASMAWLKATISLNPIPPKLLGKHIFFQGNQCTFLLLSRVPYQKSINKLLSSEHRKADSLKHPIAYVGTT